MPIKTFKGSLPIGVEKRIRLSTADGLTGYRIVKFDCIQARPGTDNVEIVSKIYTTSQEGAIAESVNFDEADLMAVNYYKAGSSSSSPTTEKIIFDKEIFNQDIYIYAADASGATQNSNYYIELEQIKLNINESTFATLKNIRNNQQN
tara:strand:- start:155 stop:598 length:444 start_codon:yes stop_codon:yes gene_type:complete